ncbi:hypothetical protein C8Q74DRAFT_1222158 [Fomes fomentarius]|nr:hypothetical protein C8Q74DRAFT_1222158 [Fomes fomentarius]
MSERLAEFDQLRRITIAARNAPPSSWGGASVRDLWPLCDRSDCCAALYALVGDPALIRRRWEYIDSQSGESSLDSVSDNNVVHSVGRHALPALPRIPIGHALPLPAEISWSAGQLVRSYSCRPRRTSVPGRCGTGYEPLFRQGSGRVARYASGCYKASSR